MNVHTERLLLSTLFRNAALHRVEHSIARLKSITVECIRRNKLLVKLKLTMGNPASIPTAPVALHAVCSSSSQQVGSSPCFLLVQKMMEANVFCHTAAVYRFENIRASSRIQTWWRKTADFGLAGCEKENDPTITCSFQRECNFT